jgi:hypothetical protein
MSVSRSFVRTCPSWHARDTETWDMRLSCRSLHTLFGIPVNQNTVGGLSLAGVAHHGIVTIVRIFARDEFDRSTSY